MINASNYAQTTFEELMAFVGPIYLREVPEYGVDKTFHLSQLEEELIYFSNNYSFLAELWAMSIHQVRVLRHAKSDKAAIDEAMDKRDYLDRVLAATKLKYHAISRLMSFYMAPDYNQGR